mgnify:FL=1|jgi:hypothetical protein
MSRDLNNLIEECIRETLLEMDIVPTDKNGNINLVRNKSINNWRMIYNLMDNVKCAMDATWQDKNGKITQIDVSNIVNYIFTTIDGILK